MASNIQGQFYFSGYWRLLNLQITPGLDWPQSFWNADLEFKIILTSWRCMVKKYGQMFIDRNKHMCKYWMEKKLSAELQRWIWSVE